MRSHPSRAALLDHEGLSPDERQELLTHLRGCAECRATVAEADPSRLFALLAQQEIPGAALDRLSQRIASTLEITEDVTESKPVPGAPTDAARTWRPAWGALAASVLLAGAFSAYVWLSGDSLQQPPLAGVEGQVSVRELSAEVDSVEPQPGAEETIPTVELLAPAAAQVVNFMDGDTQYVMIFDETMDL